jgi:hypothetical protein
MSNPSRLRLVIIAPIVLIVLGGAVFLGLKKNVKLRVNNDIVQLRTFALTVGSFLHEQGITIAPKDELSPSQDAWLKNGDTVILQRASSLYSIRRWRAPINHRLRSDTLDLLRLVGVSLYLGDQVYQTVRLSIRDHPLPANIQSISSVKPSSQVYPHR